MWGSGGPLPEKFSVLRWLNTLKFNSKHFGNPRDWLNTRVYNGKLIKASLDDSSICIALHLHWLGKG